MNREVMERLSINEYQEICVESLKRQYGAFADVYAEDVWEFNHTLRPGLSVVVNETGQKYSMSIYKDYFNVELGSHSDVSISNWIKAISLQCKRNTELNSDVLDPEQVNNLFYFLINFEQNKELLRNIPHRKFFDYAVVYCIAEVLDDCLVNPRGLLCNAQIQRWGITENELWKLANQVAGNRFKYEIWTIGGINATEYSKPSVDKDCSAFMCSITNQYMQYSTGSIFQKQIMENIAEKMNGNFFLLPSSIHEWVILNEAGRRDLNLSEIVAEINELGVSSEEVLGTQVLYYNAENQHFLVGETETSVLENNSGLIGCDI